MDESFPCVDDRFVWAGVVVLAGALESFAFAFALALAFAGEEGAAFGEGVVVFYVGHGCGCCGGEWCCSCAAFVVADGWLTGCVLLFFLD